MADNAYFLGSERIPLSGEEAAARLIQRLRQYLELRHLAVLVGNGCSIPLGAPAIDNVSKIIAELSAPPFRLEYPKNQKKAQALLARLAEDASPVSIESLLTVLANIQATEQITRKATKLGTTLISASDARLAEQQLKKWIFHKCKSVSAPAISLLRHHEELFRRLLLRSASLPRAKIFTTNYDLLIERALDNLGVVYFDGFLGTLNRTLRTESYHYDLYYPGDTTEGRVSRVDRVLHLYKLHGSINWRRRANIVDDVVIGHTEPQDEEYGDVMIYPSPLKATEMNGYPYAEMFRHFSAHINQQQSVLITIGYKFQDSHINRLIYQALSIPSFVLIVVSPTVQEPGPGGIDWRHEIWRLTQLASKRILVLTGASKGPDGRYDGGAGTLQDFSTKWLPDITELAVEANARDEARRAFTAPTAPLQADEN